MARKSTTTRSTDIAWRATAAVATLASGFVVDRLVSVGWRAATGKPAPQEDDRLLDYRLAEIVAFAVISGAAATLVRELSLRQAAKWYGGRTVDPLKGQRAIKA
ncbi:DUF4235 domain-containing protein [Actinomyces wuliandei]|uniref:DUF4235 domain-containing protein n=1 Tax=Actinomyces wuliandei TaxID=2057743 RepID=UPI000FD994B4|nr:DUF4235 domain-containing protein [Actinomyces wuliandei]